MTCLFAWLAPGPAVAAAAVGAPDQAAVTAVIHAIVCGVAGADVAHDAPLSQAGLDSLAFVELRNELSRCCWNAPCSLVRFLGRK